ncbi:YbdD/YjiX family protein [Paraburkholderia strydomiana]|uniref:YbdD/YjiX family protein n=1 Tax=Paraburkholderia strydomiana TaxID=1245417 RepID=UPI001BECA525|nr:YbdD/YjiX family protein [Paraburkholderia strydomiana]MBT2792729.1 YbdD/YjiX family protein [Paraburkholderia strydomiana]
MKTVFNGKLVAVPGHGTNNRPGSTALATRLSELARTMRGACMQMFGMPDYERYVEHMASRHPCDPLMSRGEFFTWAVDRKYCRNGPRCC